MNVASFRAGAFTRLLGMLIGAFPWLTATAQTPGISPDPMGGTELLGEQYCFDAAFSNTGATGYGPYLRLLLPPEVSFSGASLFGTGLSVVANATFPASGMLTDPLFLPASAPGNQVSGTEGWRLVILELPLGSVVAGGPELSTEICVTSNNTPPNLADVGTAYPIQVTPVYRYGDAPTGANGSIPGAPVSPMLTPQVLLLYKDNTAPENERPPGPAWQYDYVMRVDIADGALIQPLIVRDTLPAAVQYVGPITITGGVACTTTDEPSTSAPGGGIGVTCSGATLGTAADTDVEIRFPVYITDLLDETTCAVSALTNTATADAQYVPAGSAPEDPAIVLPQVTDSSAVTAKHVAVQKTADQQYRTPSSDVTYTLNLQTTQFDATTSLVVVDELPDGVDFDVGSATIQIGGGAATPIVPTHTPGHPETLSFDVVAANGGAPIPAATPIVIQYRADILQNYESTGEPILASDPLTNQARADYTLEDGASGCGDTSAATVTIDPVDIHKQLLTPGPFAPGDSVTFRLTMEIPSGDTQGVVFTDYLPLPVFDVDDVNLTYGGPDIQRASTDTMGLLPIVTTNPLANALILTYPDIHTTQAQVVSVDITVRVQPNVFADGLHLTNVFRAVSANSELQTESGEAPAQLQVLAPTLVLIKGVLSTNGGGTIAPAGTPANGDLSDADAGDQVVYRITLENTGNAPAYEVVVLDTLPAGLTCTTVAAQLEDGTPLATSGNLFAAPGLTLGAAGTPVLAKTGDPGDTAFVDVTCTIAANVAPNQNLTNTASATWKSLPAGAVFPSVQDDAQATIRNVALVKSVVATSETDSTGNNVMIGEIVRYRLQLTVPEGQIPAAIVRDALPSGLQYLADGTARIALVSNGGLTATGVGAGAAMTALPASPMTTAGAAITATAGTGGSNTFACAGTSFGEGTDPCFSLGDVSNADSDPDAEYIVIEFNALVLNVSGNVAGTNRDNNFRLGSDGVQMGPASGNARVTTRLPGVTVGKTVTPDTGVQAGDTVAYTLTIGNPAGAGAPAYDVSVSDVLPSQLTLLAATFSSTSTGSASAFVGTPAGNTVSGTIARIPPGGQVVIQYQATVLVSAAPGTSIPNSVTAAWNSLPGPNGTSGNATGSNTPGASGEQTGERTWSQAAVAPIAIEPVGLGKVVTATSLPYTADGRVRAGIADLAIGEIATFHITATIPEGTTPEVIITDVVPATAAGRMEVLSGSVVSIGSGMTIATPNPSPAITNEQLADAFNDTIRFNFGQVVNPVGNNTPTAQTIVVEVVARLVDHDDNENGDELTNTATVQYGTNLSGTATAGVDVVEPLLEVEKTGSLTEGQAGDSVNFTVVVQHATGSNMEARAVQVTDVLPAPGGLVGPVGVNAVLSGAGCAVLPAPVVDTSNTSVGTLDVRVDSLPLDCQLQITYAATLASDVTINTDVINRADLSWHSITPGAPEGPGRDYSGSDAHAVTVTSPGMSKWVASVSPDIGSGQVSSSLPDVPIGGVVTWQFDVEFPAGDSLAAVVADQLPTGTVSMRVESSRIVSVGAGIVGINTTATPVAGTAGGASDGADADAFNDRVSWALGDLRAAAGAAAQRTMRFEVVARVMSSPQSTGGVSVRNTASFTASTVTTPITANADVDIVEPHLTLSKTLTLINGAAPDPARIVQAGDTLTFAIQVAHATAAPVSTADAFNVVVEDQLPSPGLSLVSGSVSSTCGTPALGGTAPQVTFALPNPLVLGNSCTITYSAQVTNDVNPGSTYANDAVAGFDSLPAAGDDGVRHSETSHDSEDFTILAPRLVKVVTSSSNADTGAGQHDAMRTDLAIGESVTYTLTIGFPQGTTASAVLIDTLPAGLEAIGAAVATLGNSGITTSLPGTPAYSDSGVGYNDTVTFDFGTITNPANASVGDDWIQVTVTARVKDVAPGNADAVVLTNTATFSNGTSADVQASADVELVEPALTLSKAMVAGTNGSATITLTVTNNGTGPAYDVAIEDVLSHAVWSASSIAPATTPAGFTAALVTSTPGQTTVRFASNAGVALLPGASAVATFTATLATFPPNPNPVQNTAEVPGYGSVPADPTNPDRRDYDPEDASDTLGFPDVAVTKTVANTGSGTGGAFVPGDVVVFNVAVANTGAAALTGASLSETVPPHTTFVAASSHADWAPSCVDGAAAGSGCVLATPFSVPANGSVTYAFAVRIDTPLPSGIERTANQAVLTAPGLPEDVPSDDPGTPGDPDDPTEVPILAAPDLVLTKVDNIADGTYIAPGGTIVYTLSYRNAGNQDATGVFLTEHVPANTTFNAAASSGGWMCAPDGNAGAQCTYTVGTVAAGMAAVNVLFAVDVVDPVPAGVSSIGNSARVDDDGNNGTDPNPDNNADDETTPLQGTPGLHLTKTDNDALTWAGGSVLYVLQYWNDGDQDVANAVLTETVPANTTFDATASLPTVWSCADGSVAGTTCTVGLGTLPGQTPAAAAGTANFALRVVDPLPAETASIVNTAVLGGTGQTDVPAQDSTPVVAPDMVIVKTSASTAVPGEVVVYDLAYANLGGGVATGVVLSETVPAHASFEAASSTAGWTCVPDASAGSTCSLNVGAVPAGQTLPPATVVQFAVRIDEPLPAAVDQLSNTASIADDGSHGPDGDPDNNTDDDVRDIGAAPDLSIVKRARQGHAAPGTVVVFDLTYANNGNQDATGVIITETVPVGTTFAAAGSSAGWTCMDGAAEGTTCELNVGALAAGGVQTTVQFAVLVQQAGEVVNTVHIADDGDNGPDPTPENNDSEARVSATPVLVPVDARWAMLLLAAAMLALGWRRRRI